MKKAMMAVLLVCVGFGSAQAQLKIDFGITGSPVESGYQAYTATLEVGNTFTPQSFGAFGATITVALTWPSGPADTAKQMFDRTTDARYAYTGEHGDLIRDWTGTDGRVASANPLVLTLSGMPAGTYSWLSYHHDGIDQTGVFSVTVKDASGSATTADLPITNSSGGDNVTDFASVSTFATQFSSNGKDDVVFEFTLTSSSGTLTTAFFVMNGFDIEILTALNLSSAHKPSPSNEATDVLGDVVLSWIPGQYAASHDVYLGTTFEDVNNANRTAPAGFLVSQGQDANAYDPANLEFGQTYYWRVDEINAPDKPGLYKGNVWSFTTEPYGFPITTPITATASSQSNVLTGPEKTIDGSGLNGLDQHSTSSSQMWLSKKNVTPIWIQYEFDAPYKLYQMWVWNQNQLSEPDNGVGAMEVTIETSTDGITWTSLEGVPEFAPGPGEETYVHNTTVDFGGVLAKYVKLNIISNWGGLKQAGLSEVRFFYIPVKAFGPTPASVATGVALNATLNWRPGREAASHEVYLGTDPNALSKVNTVTQHSYDLSSAGLQYDRTYYWKVNEVNDAKTPKTWEGDVWSFSTVVYTVVDDFESYNDLCKKIFYTWVDQSGYNAPAECGGAGAPGNGSGALVGNAQAPYAERAIVHGGAQSLPMSFDNKTNPFYSETQREWTTPQVWSTGGANTLKVFFRGEAPAFLETSPGNIVMSGTGTDIWNTADQGRFAYKSLTGDGSLVARVLSLANTDPWAKAGVMIRETLQPDSTHVMALYGGANGARIQARLTAAVAAINDTTTATPAQIAARAPVWVKLERKGNQFNGYYATDAAGTIWTPMAGNPQTITMPSTVYIGLAVTSHTAATDTTDIVCGARFSSVSTQGNVTGSWLLADLGLTQPTGGNAPEIFYVAVQDGSGKIKAVSHPDPVALASGAWEEWNVPLSQITSAGVNLGNVKKLVVGVGDRNAPKAGGAGKVYIDDIRLTRITAP